MILELFSSYLSLLKETTDVKILIDDLIIQNGTSKLAKLFLTYLVHHSASAFDFHGKWKPATRKTFLPSESEKRN